MENQSFARKEREIGGGRRRLVKTVSFSERKGEGGCSGKMEFKRLEIGRVGDIYIYNGYEE